MEEQTSLAEKFFYETAHSLQEIGVASERLMQAGSPYLRGQILLTEAPLPEAIARYKSSRRATLQAPILHDTFLSGRVHGSVGRGETRRELAGRFVAISFPSEAWAWLLLTHGDRDFERGPLRYFLQQLRPRMTRPILRTDQIERVFSEVRRSLLPHLRPNDPEPRIAQVGSRTQIKSQGARRPVESDRRWTDLDIGEAFKEAREAGQWVTDALLSYGGSPNKGYLRITRRGGLTFKNHARLVLEPASVVVAKLGVERYAFLRGRERAARNRFVNRPFSLDFDRPLFDKREELVRVDSILHHIPHVTCTVLHGNPYYHAVLVDYTDGSSYEVLVLSATEITVIPQGRSTPRALQRLSAAIFKDFREGSFKEAF